MRRRRIQKKRRKDGLSAGTIVLLLLLVAAFVYVFQALGIYDMILNPSARPSATLKTSAAKPTQTTTPASSPSAGQSASTASGKVTEEIKMGSITLYGVQLGVFSKEENATTAAEKYKKQGAAGYILKEDAMFRVLDSVYYTQSDAKAVRDQYKDDSETDAYLLNVEASGINWKVSASQEQIDAIKSAISVLQKEVVALINVQKQAIQQQGSLADGRNAVKSSAQNLANANTALKKAVGNTSSAVINSLSTCLEESSENLNKLANDNSADLVAFRSGLKYNIIDILLKLQKDIMEAK